MAKTRYSFLQRLLHWVIVVIVFGLLTIGFTLWSLGYEGAVNLFGNDLTNQLYGYHKSFGITVFLLVVLRLLLFRFAPPPPYDPPLGKVERAVSGGVHLLLYLLLLGMPIVGWVATATGGFPIQFFGWDQPGLDNKNEALSQQLFLIHGISGLVLLGLILVHIGAAIMHWRRRDGVMRRIGLP